MGKSYTASSKQENDWRVLSLEKRKCSPYHLHITSGFSISLNGGFDSLVRFQNDVDDDFHIREVPSSLAVSMKGGGMIRFFKRLFISSLLAWRELFEKGLEGN